jgi:hypothetical protein
LKSKFWLGFTVVTVDGSAVVGTEPAIVVLVGAAEVVAVVAAPVVSVVAATLVELEVALAVGGTVGVPPLLLLLQAPTSSTVAANAATNRGVARDGRIRDTIGPE